MFENITLNDDTFSDDTCIGRYKPRAASLPGRTEEMKMQDGQVYTG